MKKIFQLLFEAFIKKEGRKPNNLEMILLKQKAMNQAIDERKILDMRGDVLDPNKPILGGTQSGTKLDKEFAAGIMKATGSKPTGSKPTAVKQIFMSDKDFKDLRRSFRMNIIRNDRQFNEDLAKQIINREIYTDLAKGQRKNLLDDLDQVFKGEQGLAGGGIAGMLGEPTYQDDIHRVPFKDAKSVEGPMGPQNFYDIGFGSILDDVMRDSPKKRYTKKDLENIWNILQGEHDVENWKDELMFRFGRHDPDKKSHLFLELGKDKKGIGWKKQIDFNKWLMGKADGGRVPYDSGNMVLPKEKPTALNWLDTLDSKAALNTLGPRTYFDMVAKFATEAKDKGDLSEKEYMEIMQPFFGRGGETLTRKIDEEREYLDEYQTGGRVPLGKGKSALQGLAKIMDEFFPGTTKIGKTSKPMAEKTQLKKAIADFQKREKKSRQLTDDEYDDFVDELGGEDHLEAYTFDGTVGDAQRILKEQKDYHDYMYQQYKMGKLEPKAGEVNRGRLNLLRERADEAGSSGDPKLFSRDDYDELEYLEDHFKQVDKEESFQFAERIRKAKEKARVNKKSPWYTDPKTLTPEEQLRREFPGITDENINLILTDKDPQRIAEVKATLHEALKMQQKGMGHEEIIKIFKKKPTKHASGGLAGMLGE